MPFLQIMFCSLVCLFCTAPLYAATSHYTITNNTSCFMSVTTTSSGSSILNPEYWQSFSGSLPAYQQQTVLTVSRDQGLKKNTTYQFTVHVYAPLCHGHPDLNVTQTVSVKTNDLYGSQIAFNESRNYGKTTPIFIRSGLDTIWLDKRHQQSLQYENRLHAGQLFNDYHLVFSEHSYPTVPKENTSLRMLTYNTKLLPAIANVETPMNHPLWRAEAIPAHLDGYDLIAFNEAFDPIYRQQLINGLKKSYPYVSEIAGNQSGKLLSSGVFMVSRWPIIKQMQHVYTHCGGWDCGAAKGVLGITIDKQGKLYHLFASHLQAGHQELKAGQLDEFSSFLKQYAAPADEPILISGDFNLNDKNPEQMKWLRTKLATEIIPLSGFPYSTDYKSNTMNNGHGQGRIDYILPIMTHQRPSTMSNKIRVFRDLTHSRLWPQFDLSDHYAVEGYFRYPA